MAPIFKYFKVSDWPVSYEERDTNPSSNRVLVQENISLICWLHSGSKNFFWINISRSRKILSRLENGVFHMNYVQLSSRIHFTHSLSLLSVVSSWHFSHLWIPEHTNVFFSWGHRYASLPWTRLLDSSIIKFVRFLVNFIWTGKEHDSCYESTVEWQMSHGHPNTEGTLNHAVMRIASHWQVSSTAQMLWLWIELFRVDLKVEHRFCLS